MDQHKHRFNLLKTVEGTGWVLCDALDTMVRNNIQPSYENNGSVESQLANNMAEIFEVVSECEEPEVIDFLAEKIIEYAGNDINMYLSYMDANMGDNPLYKRVYEMATKG
ncbi:Acyl-CoA dehydrogenase C-terminal domain-containing protein [Thermohalobacter berrensis]|uniref:Uncharacterized protein n=1 Tax=Thermohalobacter berrensis TaxID=99594 RepID=A0A419T5C7_9FIRM|nr:Acyl-CoA dehydrogenase C-terminal domain-containing protein [Thermohalobacter berrensis]RKD32730.1 hypothetical protein BET03_10370 [Thermohalobacter berrensis]